MLLLKTSRLFDYLALFWAFHLEDLPPLEVRVGCANLGYFSTKKRIRKRNLAGISGRFFGFDQGELLLSGEALKGVFALEGLGAVNNRLLMH